MTIEEEMIQARPRRRMDGFSADGLSYSVASDFDKMLGQAMAEFDARRQDPRFVPGARVESPDAPDLLRQELLDPVFAAANAFQGRSVRPQTTAAPRLFEMGNQLVSVDPATGRTSVVHNAPQRPDNTARNFELGRIRDRARALEGLKLDPNKQAMAGLSNDAIEQELQKLNESAQAILNPTAPVAPPTPAPAAAPQPQMFIGTPGATNAIDEAINIGAVPQYSAAAARRVAPPQPGDVRGGYRFKGGNPKERSNWEQVK